jgi:hypothetical protein
LFSDAASSNRLIMYLPVDSGTVEGAQILWTTYP